VGQQANKDPFKQLSLKGFIFLDTSLKI